MKSLLTLRVALLGASLLLLVLVLALGAAPADAAASGHPLVPDASIIGTLTSPIGSVFSAIGGAVLGAFSWTVTLATKFISVTLGAFVRMLIPRSWAKDAVALFQWIVAIPDYAGTVTSPGGGHVYGFAGVNDLRQLFQWLGIGLLPLTLVYATSRAMLGRGDHIAAPVARVVILAALLACYPYLWEQAAALTNQLTHLILSPAPVITGIHKLMAYAVDGVALGGWQLIDLGLMAALALELLALIFAKVVIILLGALLFATGPLMIGLVPTDSGDVIARAWISAVATLLMLPVAWAALFAVGAVLIDDASTAGPLIGGSTPIGTLLGGVIVAVAGVATLWLCLKAAREVGGLLRLQLGGLLVLAARGRSRSPATATAATAGNGRLAAAAGSIRTFQGKVSAAGSAALDAAGPRTAAAARSAGTVGRRGLLLSSLGGAGSAGLAAGRLAARSPAGSATRPHLAAAGATAAIATATPGSRAGRAGAAAARMARAGSAAWQQPDPAQSRRTAPATRQGASTAGRAEPSRPSAAQQTPAPSATASSPSGARDPAPPAAQRTPAPSSAAGSPSGSRVDARETARPATQRTPAPSSDASSSSGSRVDARDPARPAGSPRPASNGGGPVRSAANRTADGSETNGAARESRTPASQPPVTRAPTSRSPTRSARANDRPSADRASAPPAPERARQTPPRSQTPSRPRPGATPPNPSSGRD
jgi:hypothetical protein